MKTRQHLLTALLLSCAIFSGSIVAVARQSSTSPAPVRTDATAKPEQPQAQSTPAAQVKSGPQKIVSQGIEVEFTVEPLDKPAEVMEGHDAVIKFKITDTATRTPLSGVNPSVWMSQREGESLDAKVCREKIQSYLQGSLRARPDVDLNTYFVLALNQEPNISVIDPLLGFGGSKLLTLVLLRSPGEDWVQTSDREKLFVSMPEINQVAVVDTNTWKVVNNIETGMRPMRLALQPDEKYLWVGTDGPGEQSGVTVIDTATLKAVSRIATGAGHHEIAMSGDNAFAFVSNRDDATLSVIDVQKLTRLRDIKIDAPITSVAVSPLSKAVYVASEQDGQIAVVDSREHRILTRIQTAPGIGVVRFATGGRYGFVPNAARNTVFIFDASTNRLLHTASVGKRPDQIAFTGTFAYVRSAGTEEVNLIRLSTVGKELDIVKFPGGQTAPERASTRTSLADAVVPAPEGNSALVANVADRVIYYYTEGMAAPMGSFQNYRRDPRAVMIVDRSLRETSPGLYTATTRLPKRGIYDVAFLLDSPRITNCFETEAKADPSIKSERAVALRVEHLNKEKQLRVGQDFKLRFRLIETATGKPKDGLKDVRVLTFLAPGIWQRRDFAQPVGEGVYELNVNVPQTGIYYIFIESQSQGVSYRQLPYLIMQAVEAPATPPGTGKTQ